MSEKVATSTEAGRAVASNLQARRQQAAQDARAQSRADLAAQRADTTTPLGQAPPAFETEELFSNPAPPLPAQAAPAADPPKPAPAIVLSFQTIYRGRLITITGEHMSLDQFCDLLDKRLGVPQ